MFIRIVNGVVCASVLSFQFGMRYMICYASFVNAVGFALFLVLDFHYYCLKKLLCIVFLFLFKYVAVHMYCLAK